ncbi:MAG: squalene/phytoene synthase family protein [Rhodospirillales bacterium]
MCPVRAGGAAAGLAGAVRLQPRTRPRHEAAREPALALIRLQWWREVVEGAKRRHEVASPLSALIGQGVLPPAPLLSMIEAREAEADAPATLEAFLGRMRLGPGALAVAAGIVLGADAWAEARLRELGAACGVAGTLRNVRAFARQERCVLPRDVLDAAGLVPETAFGDPDAVLAAVRPTLVACGRDLLGRPGRLPRAIVAAGLPAVLARRDLARGAPVGPRGASDRLAVVWAAARSVV